MCSSVSFGNWGFGDYPIGRRWMDDQRKVVEIRGPGEATLYDANGYPERIWFRDRGDGYRLIFPDLIGKSKWRYLVAYMDGHDHGDEQ